METTIATENISKSYGSTKAVDNVSINVSKGEIYGFLGLNGAGKTTTIRMLLGLVHPSKGTAYLHGMRVSPGNLEIWQNVGYLVEIPYSYPDLTVWENLEIIRRLRHIENKNAVSNIISKLKLTNYRDVAVRNLSLGNKQRLGLSKALIHNPEILLLDEPANGLDPEGIVEIRELLIDLAGNEGVTVFISSHILGEISRFATRIGIIHEGKLLQESSSPELETLRKKSLRIKCASIEGAVNVLRQYGYRPEINEGIIELSDPSAVSEPEKAATLLVNSGFPPSMLKVEEEDLETFFLRVINSKQ